MGVEFGDVDDERQGTTRPAGGHVERIPIVTRIDHRRAALGGQSLRLINRRRVVMSQASVALFVGNRRGRERDPVLADARPAWGRFISEDPSGSRGGVNAYNYAGNSPPNNTDPLGLCRADDILCQIATRNAGLPPAWQEPTDLPPP
jgi:RHS repeat-associated protein